MKTRIFMLCVLVFSFWGCGTVAPESEIPKVKTDFTDSLEIRMIDGCEYLYGPWANATVLTHKGNCKNPIHWNQR